MADLCILAGQAVMQVGSHDLQVAMRVVLGVLGREIAIRHAADDAVLAGAHLRTKPIKVTKTVPGAASARGRRSASLAHV